MSTTAYQDLIRKLDDFIRQYYKNRMLRGLFLTLLLIVVTLVFGAILEYLNHFRPTVKTILVFFLTALWAFVALYYFLWPFLQFLRIGKIISYRQASNIISRHFKDVEDKLLNTLELKALSGTYTTDLVDAAIRQKAEALRSVPFVKAIDSRQTKKIIWIFLITIGVSGIVYLFNPLVLKEGTQNLLHYDVYVEPPNPFHFVLKNTDLSVESGQDLTITVQVEGSAVPEKIMLVSGGQSFLMKQTAPNLFTYTFKSLLNSLSFYFSAGNYQSRDYDITVLPIPIMKNIIVEITPPAYTGLPASVKNTAGDLVVPAGSSIRWSLKTEYVDSVFFRFPKESSKAQYAKQAFRFSKQIFQNTTYQIQLFNQYLKHPVSSSYHINIVPDGYPEIQVRQYADSLHPTAFYFSGIIKDDYGFTKLSFNYAVSNDSVVSIPIKLADGSFQAFEYGFDFSTLVSETKKITYYFEVWDNDAIHGAKSTRSAIYYFEKPSATQLDSIENTTNEAVKKKLDESKKLAEDIKKDIEKLKRDKIDKQMSAWEKQKLLQSIAEKQQQLEKILKKTAEQNRQKNELQKNFSKQSKEIAEKQKEIQKLLDKVMDDELKKLMEELRKLMEQHADEKKLEQKTNEMSMRFEELSKQLDKNLELLKRYEVEKRMEQLSQELDKLAEEQKTLSREVKKKSNKLDELTKKQVEQKQAFEKLKEEYKQTQEKNDKLETPYKLDDFKEQMGKIANQFKQGQEQMKAGKRSKSSKTQKQNAHDLSKLAQQMASMMQQQMAQQAGEDIEKLKALTDNIITFSFEQEDLMKTTKKMTFRNPKINDLRRRQHKLAQSFSIVEDSLFALSKRHPVLDQTVQKELTNIMLKLNKVETLLQNNRMQQAAGEQQFIMTSANNLALLLDEITRQMQKQQKNQQQGNQSCPNPGNSNPQMGQMKSQMQSLKQQLQQMINEMKQGKSGTQKGNGKKHNQKLGKMLSEYEKFNQALQEMMNGETLSPEGMRQLNEIKRLVDQNINDIINDNVTRNTLKRHADIKVRLLESEKAKRKRKMDKERESREAHTLPHKTVNSYFQRQPKKVIFNDLLKKSNIKLTKFYEQKYKEYLLELNNAEK